MGALAILANIVRAFVEIAGAVLAVWREHTTGCWVARVVGADITVFALDTRSRADAVGADISAGASIVIVAGAAFIHRCHFALAAFGLAGVFGAGSV